MARHVRSEGKKVETRTSIFSPKLVETCSLFKPWFTSSNHQLPFFSQWKSSNGIFSFIIWIRSSQYLGTKRNLSMSIFKRIPTSVVFNMVLSTTVVHAQFSTFFSSSSFLCFQIWFADNKLKTIFLQPKKTYESPQQCWLCRLRVSKANLFWFLKSTFKAHTCASVSSCRPGELRNLSKLFHHLGGASASP